MTAHGDEVRLPSGAGPLFSGREPDLPAIQSYPHAEANLPTRYPTHRKTARRQNALRFPHLAHRSAAAHKLHSTPTRQDEFDFGRF